MFACTIAGQVGNAGELETNFIYDEARPYEVRLQTVSGDDIVISRDTISESFATEGTHGVGWITFHKNGSVLYVGLRMGGMIRTIAYPADLVMTFLDQSYDVVPWGSESMDMDALLDDFYNDKI